MLVRFICSWGWCLSRQSCFFILGFTCTSCCCRLARSGPFHLEQPLGEPWDSPWEPYQQLLSSFCEQGCVKASFHPREGSPPRAGIRSRLLIPIILSAMGVRAGRKSNPDNSLRTQIQLSLMAAPYLNVPRTRRFKFHGC